MAVSDTSPHNSSSRFPVWSPLLVMTAVLLTGLVIGWGSTTLPTGYFVLFAAAMVVCTLFVEPRGLFLTVASFPLWFVVGTFIIARIAAPSGGSAKAKLATSAYPIVQHYLWLAVTMLICVLLAAVRWWRYREGVDRARARATQRRRRQSDANRSNEELSQRARSRAAHRRSATSGKNVPFDPARFQQRRAEGSRSYSREDLRASSERRRGVPGRADERSTQRYRSSEFSSRYSTGYSSPADGESRFGRSDYDNRRSPLPRSRHTGTGRASAEDRDH